MPTMSSSSSSNLTRSPTSGPVVIRIESTSATIHENATTIRPRTWVERQPYLIGYGAAISLVSPAATAYQLCRLYHITKSPVELWKLSAAIFPHQTVLKAVQMNASTPVKEHLNPWAAFAVVGILQGGVYGQCNVHFSRVLQLGTTAVSLRGVFRGSGFAALRDMLSQGVPFCGSGYVQKHLLDPYFPTPTTTTTEQEVSWANSVKQWTAVLSTSVVATYLSQGLHNGQIAMQSNANLGYVSAVRTIWQQHGIAMLYRGAEARVGLLLLVNGLNEILLKPAWAPVVVANVNDNSQGS